MTGTKIRVGIVGANLHRGWAAWAHVPALAELDEYELVAVATRRPETAREAAATFHVPHAFTDAGELAAHPYVDLVVVSVRAAGHSAAVRAALAAGKHVLCEWPLTVRAAEAVDLADAATAAGVVHAVGLQAYASAGARFVRDVLDGGRIGRVESVSFIGAGDPLGGGRIPQGLAWSTAADAGNSLLSIMVGHTLATIDQIAGQLVEVSAVAANLHDRVEVAGTGETMANEVAGQVAVAGRFAGGGVASIVLHGGSAPGPDGFHLKIAGTEGTLTVTPAQPGQYSNWAEWRVRIAPVDGVPEDLPVPERYRVPGVPVGPVANVAGLYRQIGQAIMNGRQAHPSFHVAARHQRTLEAIEQAARTGVRQHIGEVVPA